MWRATDTCRGPLFAHRRGGAAAPARAASACARSRRRRAAARGSSRSWVETARSPRQRKEGARFWREASASRVGFLRLSVLCLVISILPFQSQEEKRKTATALSHRARCSSSRPRALDPRSPTPSLFGGQLAASCVCRLLGAFRGDHGHHGRAHARRRRPRALRRRPFWDILLRRTATHGKLRGLLNSWLAHSMEEDERGARGGWSREPSSSGIYDAAPATDAPLSMAFEPEHSLVVREVISAQRLQGGGGGGGVHPPAPRDGAQDDDASQLAAASSEASTSEAGASEAAPTATASSSTAKSRRRSGNVTRRSSPNIDAGSRSSSAPSLDSGRGLDGADAWSWRRTKSNGELLRSPALEQRRPTPRRASRRRRPGPPTTPPPTTTRRPPRRR